MGNLVAAAIGASVSLLAVALGALLQSRREERNWLRAQRLQAAVEYLTTARHLLVQYRRHGEDQMDQGERKDFRRRMQLGRSALHLLYDNETVEVADGLAKSMYRTTPHSSDPDVAATDAAFKELVGRLRDGLR